MLVRVGKAAFLGLMLAIGSVSLGWAEVRVTFAGPEGYTDAALDRSTGKGRGAVLEELALYLQTLGDRYLGKDQILAIEIRDIDLAGKYEPWRVTAQDTRFLRGDDWPRIALSYRLEQAGATLQSGAETLRDREYLARPESRLSQDPLRYEKTMLEDWFRRRFDAANTPSSR